MGGGGAAEEAAVDGPGGGTGRIRSPRIRTWGWITARPPRMMCWVPCSWERRATLLPVSVSMYSPFGGLDVLVEVEVEVGGMVGGWREWGGIGQWQWGGGFGFGGGLQSTVE